MIRSQQLTLVFISIFFLMYGLYTEISAKDVSRNTSDELVISSNFDDLAEDEITAIIASGGFFLLCTSLLLIATRSSKFFYLVLALELTAGAGFVALLWVYRQAKNNTITTIFNEQGIWDQYYGTISWEDIKKVSIARMPYSSAEFIGITIKEVSLPMVKKQKIQEGKWGKFYDADSYGCHLFIAPMSVSLERILAFADRFVE